MGAESCGPLIKGKIVENMQIESHIDYTWVDLWAYKDLYYYLIG